MYVYETGRHWHVSRMPTTNRNIEKYPKCFVIWRVQEVRSVCKKCFDDTKAHVNSLNGVLVFLSDCVSQAAFDQTVLELFQF